MPQSDAFIITIAYPETIVLHAEEWYSKFLKFIFIGNKNYVRAGHAALVLIHKRTGVLEYHDFGRYISPSPFGRVRSAKTDFELNFSLKAEIKNNTIENLNDILNFFATNPKITHGHGNMFASVNSQINYSLAKKYMEDFQNKGFVRYAAFIKKASNCARFVTDVLIASTVNFKVRKALERSKLFTPSTIGNVVIADTENYVYHVSSKEEISKFNSTVSKLNRRLFFDSIKAHSSKSIGTILPKYNPEIKKNAQWLHGVGAGAWFEIYDLSIAAQYRCRRISSYGNVDCDGVYTIDDYDFDINLEYQFMHNSNCGSFQIRQNKKVFRFEYVKDFKPQFKEKGALSLNEGM